MNDSKKRDKMNELKKIAKLIEAIADPFVRQVERDNLLAMLRDDAENTDWQVKEAMEGRR